MKSIYSRIMYIGIESFQVQLLMENIFGVPNLGPWKWGFIVSFQKKEGSKKKEELVLQIQDHMSLELQSQDSNSILMSDKWRHLKFLFDIEFQYKLNCIFKTNTWHWVQIEFQATVTTEKLFNPSLRMDPDSRFKVEPHNLPVQLRGTSNGKAASSCEVQELSWSGIAWKTIHFHYSSKNVYYNEKIILKRPHQI